jgi:pyoverdine/dityrosine biosynthesis protein Dit1
MPGVYIQMVSIIKERMPSVGFCQSAIETKVSQILSIIAAYRHRSSRIPDSFSKFAPVLKKQLIEIVSENKAVRFILPAFPSKGPPEGDRRKTLSSLPDKAEEISLQNLDGFAESIANLYEGGAVVVIVLDAPVSRGERFIIFVLYWLWLIIGQTL